MAKDDKQGLSKSEREELDRLRAENEQLKNAPRTISLRVGKSGGVSLYGVGRFPVTLYQEQWQVLANEMPNILKFIEEHKGELKAKK